MCVLRATTKTVVNFGGGEEKCTPDKILATPMYYSSQYIVYPNFASETTRLLIAFHSISHRFLVTVQ